MKPLYDRTKVGDLMDEDVYMITLGTVDVYKDMKYPCYYIIVYGNNDSYDLCSFDPDTYVHIVETLGPELFQQILAYINLSQ